jgi:hypothetical protein
MRYGVAESEVVTEDKVLRRMKRGIVTIPDGLDVSEEANGNS